ncbi:hypothetical protein ACFL09_04290 [Planctomycetota bacterium]
MGMNQFVVLVALAAAALGPGEQDQPRKAKAPRGKGTNRLVQMLDKDGDGAISREEYKGTDAVFGKLDPDGDGVVSAEEGAKAARYMMLITWDLVDRDELFKALDKDGDGNITAEEMKAAPLAEILSKATMDARRTLAGGGAGGAGAAGGLVGRLDKDGDGKISRDEFPAEHLDKFDRMDRNKDGFIDADESPKPRGGKPGAGGRADLMGKLDKDGDGKVTREEFPQAKIQAFDRFDKNGDGVITADELGGGKPRKEKGKKPDNF